MVEIKAVGAESEKIKVIVGLNVHGSKWWGLKSWVQTGRRDSIMDQFSVDATELTGIETMSGVVGKNI